MKLNSIGIKVAFLILLVLLLQLPSAMVMDIISERQNYQNEVREQLTESVSGEQTIMGPVLVVPYQNSAAGAVQREYVLPKDLKINGTLTSESLKRGIYSFQKYDSISALTGEFDTASLKQLQQSGKIIGTPYLAVGIADVRGLSTVGSATLNGVTVAFEPASQLHSFKNGIHAPLTNVSLTDKASVAFSLSLNLLGTGRLSYIPLGENTQLQLAGNWPNPKFSGERSPSSRTVTAKDFVATWQSSWFANNLKQTFLEAEKASDGNLLADRTNAYSFDTELIQTVDHYQLNTRSVKYSILLVGMTFLSFFMFEVLKQLRVHPIQYALVGVALSVFYLLLLALSEHIGFKWAYLAASVACVGQIGFYVCHILHSIKRGLGFSLMLAALYAAIYTLLQSEDMALLIGSVGLFVVMSVVMILTRRMNWYALNRENSPPASNL
ncbi:MAG: cell envelope integrity protein CreD [Formosimonas sp.]